MESVNECEWCEACKDSNPEHGCKTCECGKGYKRVFVLRIWKIRFIIEVHEDELKE